MNATIEVSDVQDVNKTERNTPNPDLAPNYNKPQMASNNKAG